MSVAVDGRIVGGRCDEVVQGSQEAREVRPHREIKWLKRKEGKQVIVEYPIGFCVPVRWMVLYFSPVRSRSLGGPKGWSKSVVFVVPAFPFCDI
jgi:hypothetical protein